LKPPVVISWGDLVIGSDEKKLGKKFWTLRVGYWDYYVSRGGVLALLVKVVG